MDVILYDGRLHLGDILVIGGTNGAVVTKVRGLFEPASLEEMRDKKTKFAARKEVISATGVKITCPDMDGISSGMPLRGATEQTLEEVKRAIQKEVEDVIIETDEEGIMLKADTLGSLEAMVKLFREAGHKIRRASLGPVNKKDLIDAESAFAKNELNAVILCFNVKKLDDLLVPDTVHIEESNIIYHLLDHYSKWILAKEHEQETKELDTLIRPAKLKVMENFVFRQSNPAVCGIDVLMGKIKIGTAVTKDGTSLTYVKGIQHEKESRSSIEFGNQVAMSFPNVTMGRQLIEGDILYADIPEDDFKKLKEFKKFLKEGELEVMREFAEMKRRSNPVWGI